MHKKARLNEVAFPQTISPEEWAVYQSALKCVSTAKVRFLLGGAFALAVYTGKWRDTKDLDLLVLEKDRDAVVDALTKARFEDLYDKMSYDRGWIYRATRDGFIVDVIWCMANRRAKVTEDWFENATPVRVQGELLEAVGAEELLWHKLYVMQRERCDWTDNLNLLNGVCHRLDWDLLQERIGADELLLKGLLSVFAWLCPGRLRDIPKSVRERLDLPEIPNDAPELDQQHIHWLDSRPWFNSVKMGST